MSALLNQWILWAFIVGALGAIIYILVYDYKNHQRQRPKLERRDALLTKLAQQAERLGNDVSSRTDCTGSRTC